MSKKEYIISQEDVCIWFKSQLEGHSRIELMCSLIDLCLPLELRFLGTYLEYAAGKHHAHLQKWERDANNPASFLITDLSDAKTRRRICLFMTLLHSHNKTIATKLFDVLSLYENLASLIQVSTSTSLPTKNENTDPIVEHEKVPLEEHIPQYDPTSCNEFKLLLTLSSFHPGFSFSQRQTIREKLEQFIALTNGNYKSASCKDSEGELGKETTDELEDEQASSESQAAPSLPEATLPDNSVNSTSSVNTHSIPGNIPKQGLLPTPLLQIREVHYPHYVRLPGNFAPHPAAQPILIPTSLTVLNQHEQMMCIQSAPNINTNPPQYTPNIPLQKLQNTLVNKNNTSLDTAHSHAMSSQQDIAPNTQFSSFHHVVSSKKGSETSERDLPMKQQPVLLQNHVPFQVISNSFPLNTSELLPAADINSNWGNTPVNDKSHNPINSQQSRTERNTLGSVSDLRAASSDLDVLSQKSFSDNDACETTSVDACVPARPVLSDTTTVISPNIIHCNTNDIGEYAMLYKSKLIGLPYTRGGDGGIITSNQLRPVLVAKNLTELNNIRNMHPNMPQLITPLNLHNINQMAAKKGNSSANMSSSTISTDILTVTYPNRDSIVSSMPKIHSPQVFRSTDKPTLPTGINGGYIQHDPYLSNASMENHQRQAGNQSQAYAEKNSSKISPISIQVNRKKNSVNKHILSPGGGNQLSSGDFESSPAISPAQSPRRSPYSSPSTSPMSHRKDHTNSKHIDAYASATNWLKSLRLHKYSHKFEGYSFQMMKDLTDEHLSELISTKGAQSKFKQNIEHLVKQGFIEFSSPDNPSMNDDTCNSSCNHVSSPSEGNSPSSNKMKNMSNDVQSFLLTPVLDSHATTHNDYHGAHNNFYSNEVNDAHKGKGQEGGSPAVRPVGYFEDSAGRLISESYLNDDTYEEVLTSRKQHVNLATCYNCGAKGHYGHQCIEETMEAQTYSRYAFQLDFSRRESFTNTEGKTDSGSITST